MKLRGTQQKTQVIVERTHRNMLEDVGRSSTNPDIILPLLCLTCLGELKQEKQQMCYVSLLHLCLKTN